MKQRFLRFRDCFLPFLLLMNVNGLCDRDFGEVAESRTNAVKGDGSPLLVPQGMKLEFLAGDMNRPRFLAFSKDGDLVAGSGSGDIYRLHPPYTKTEVLVNFRGYPHSVDFRVTEAGEEIWVAETDAIYVAPYQGSKVYKREDFVKIADLPKGGGHDSRTIRVGPDKAIYVSLGISGNCPDEYVGDGYPEDRRRGGIYRLDEKTKKLRPYVSGLRNPVGYDWQGDSNALYIENNGPDHWGYDQPKEVFVKAGEGSFHGMPWFQTIEGQLKKDECVESKPPQDASRVPPPVAYFPARSAPLGMVFVKDERLGKAWKGSALVALHGSWGTAPNGSANGDAATRRPPKIVRVVFQGDKATGEVEDVLTGFQDVKGNRYARPAGLAIGPDGALYISTDAGKQGLYRLKKGS